MLQSLGAGMLLGIAIGSGVTYGICSGSVSKKESEIITRDAGTIIANNKVEGEVRDENDKREATGKEIADLERERLAKDAAQKPPKPNIEYVPGPARILRGQCVRSAKSRTANRENDQTGSSAGTGESVRAGKAAGTVAADQANAFLSDRAAVEKRDAQVNKWVAFGVRCHRYRRNAIATFEKLERAGVIQRVFNPENQQE